MSGLQVTVIGAATLPKSSRLGKNDPYVIVEFQGVSQETKVLPSEEAPVWNEDLAFDLHNKKIQPNDKLHVIVKDKEKLRADKLLGEAELPLTELSKGATELEKNLKLVDASKKPTTGTCSIRIKYSPPKETKKEESGNDQGADDEGDDGNEDDEGDEAGGGGAGGAGGKRKKKKRSRRNLSNKPEDFQVRVKVIEARQLSGSNISPLCKVRCANQLKQTRVKKSTNRPFFNETFFFNLNISPQALVDEMFEFSVLNSRRLKKDSVIGSFKFDVGMVYDEPNKCFLNKWLLLGDQEDISSGAKGYLKICVAIVGAGDDAPSFGTSTQDDDEDIESNILRPAGLTLKPATLVLKLYRAEDIPRMDSKTFEGLKKMFGKDTANKELVDPYATFHFAGKNMQSSTKFNCDHPTFNEELRIGIQFPSMSDKIKLQFFDYDKIGNDDSIGVVLLLMSQIGCMADENGFLPTFGPCYLNIYGSTREYSDLPDKLDDLNKGKGGEGIAYRGRVLFELATILDELPGEDNSEPIAMEEDTDVKIEKFLRRRKYVLNVAFLSASMLSMDDSAIEFEVSIGNYGNTLEENVTPCSSTSPPTNPIFDGQFYHFLPWADNKPVGVVECHWEDISYRLYTMNYFQQIANKLRNNVAKIKMSIQADLDETRQARLIISALDDLITDCQVEMPQWQEGQSPKTQLDTHLEQQRTAEKDMLINDAVRLRREATSVEEALAELETMHAQLLSMAVEPQNSMPDVIIWMLVSSKRAFYYRVPANEVLFCTQPEYMGLNCAKVMTVNMKQPVLKEEDRKPAIPAQLRIKIWLGLDSEQQYFQEMQSEGQLAVVAETYENEGHMPLVDKWTSKHPLVTRPAWSDASGRLDLKKESINPPTDWVWDGDWYVAPDPSAHFDKDAGMTEFLEEVFEMESRYPGGAWGPADPPYGDARGEACPAMHDFLIESGWEWADAAWQVDTNRAVDEEGWEYTPEFSLGAFMPTQMMYHFCRRRRHIRTRKVAEKTDSKSLKKKAEREKAKAEGWEFAPIFEAKFHSVEKKLDQVRRRRWHRKMKPTRAGAAATFSMADDSASASESDDGESKKDKKKMKKAKLAAPRMFLQYSSFHKWQLRGYLYQARDLLPADKNGVSDPYARVCFLSQSRSTERIMKTVCPYWDQTLIFERLELFGSPDSFLADPPLVNIEIFDYDKAGKDEFIGRCQATPLVKLTASNKDDDQERRAFLNWIPITCQSRSAGELLASFELILADDEAALPPVPPRNSNKQYMVPTGIRPVLQRTAVEFLVWGLRNMDKYQLLPVNSPLVEISIGDIMKPIGPIKSLEQTPNFTEPLLLFDVMLPKEQLYMPPIHIKVRDNRPFGRRPTVGTCVLTKLDEFRTDPLADEFAGLDQSLSFLQEKPEENDSLTLMSDLPAQSQTNAISIPVASGEAQPATNTQAKTAGNTSKGGTILRRKRKEKKFDQAKMDEEIDWWSKYYTSLGETSKATNYTELNYDTINVYTKPLEQSFGGFQDVLKSFQLSRGKDLDDEENESVGELKGAIRIYPLPQDRTLPEPVRYLDKGLPSNEPVECVVRVYAVKAVDLQPNDPSGLADPFVEVCIGSEKLNSVDNYVPNSLNPEFGVMFELKTMIPVYKDLHVTVKDYDATSTNDTIGTTVIDLENRLLSKLYPICGLPQTYCVGGPNQWRDSRKPSQLLAYICAKMSLPEPIFHAAQASPPAQTSDANTANTSGIASGSGPDSGPTSSSVPATATATATPPAGEATDAAATGVATSPGIGIEIAGRIFRLSEFEQGNPKEFNCHLGPPRERLALHVLNKMPLVKEHVETRPLYSDSQPGIEQGKLIMWVDVFPTSDTTPTSAEGAAKDKMKVAAAGGASGKGKGSPQELELGPPVSITPRQPKTYEIRVIVWNTMDVILEETNLLGEQMSDIYVKGWLRDIDEKQETDVHYRSLSGEGNFNWRMVFPFGYLPAEKVVVVRKKEHFWSLDVTERRVPAVLCMQIWDNDLFNSDDFLGSVEMSLDKLPVPAKKAKDCKLEQLREFNENAETLNIFECKHTRGFWPVYSDQTESGEIELTGKLELEIELLNSDEVALKPAGQGQKEPNQNPHLDPPKRPDTSFFWFTSPWKTCKVLIWNKFKWYIIGLLVILVVAALIVLFIYTIPGLAARKMVGV